MAELEEASLLTCSRCERLSAGVHPRKGALHCDKQGCDQWFMQVGFFRRLLKAIKG